jgi:hypothetical protein
VNEQKHYDKIFNKKEELSELVTEYWLKFSDMGTWYFWFNIATLLTPLIILYFCIDKKRIFEVSFFGYTVHVLWTYTDIALSKENYLVHPHTLFLFLPIGFTVTVSLIPVAYMLLYQYCTNKGKNFYLYAIALSLVFGYGFGALSESLELLKMHKGMKLTYLVIIDIAAAFTAYWLTKLFIKLSKMNKRLT